jgi:hypothetical protein
MNNQFFMYALMLVVALVLLVTIFVIMEDRQRFPTLEFQEHVNSPGMARGLMKKCLDLHGYHVNVQQIYFDKTTNVIWDTPYSYIITCKRAK